MRFGDRGPVCELCASVFQARQSGTGRQGERGFCQGSSGLRGAVGLTLLGDKLPAEQAAQWGLIWRCVEDAELASVVDGLAMQLAVAPTRGLVRTKQAIYEGWDRTLEEQLGVEGQYQRELGWSDDYAEGVAAFTQKRAPRFTGR